LIVSAVKFCKQCLQTASASGRPPTGTSPLDPTGDFHPPDALYYSLPSENS